MTQALSSTCFKHLKRMDTAKISADTRSDVIDVISLWHISSFFKASTVFVSSSRQWGRHFSSKACWSAAQGDSSPVVQVMFYLLLFRAKDCSKISLETSRNQMILLRICKKNCWTTGSSVSLTLKSPGFNAQKMFPAFATLPTLKDWHRRKTFLGPLCILHVLTRKTQGVPVSPPSLRRPQSGPGTNASHESSRPQLGSFNENPGRYMNGFPIGVRKNDKCPSKLIDLLNRSVFIQRNLGPP